MGISTRHTLELFKTGESKAMHGQRLLKIGFKGDKKLFDSRCASVPVISDLILSELKNNPLKFSDILTEVIESAQDAVAKNLFLSSGGTLTEISDEEISIDACIAYLESIGTGGRLTKEALCVWFDESMKENLSIVLAEKLSLELEDVRISQALAAYKALFAECAAPKISLSQVQIDNLKKAIAYCSEDRISGKILSRFAALEKEQKEIVELVLL